MIKEPTVNGVIETLSSPNPAQLISPDDYSNRNALDELCYYLNENRCELIMKKLKDLHAKDNDKFAQVFNGLLALYPLTSVIVNNCEFWKFTGRTLDDNHASSNVIKELVKIIIRFVNQIEDNIKNVNRDIETLENVYNQLQLEKENVLDKVNKIEEEKKKIRQENTELIDLQNRLKILEKEIKESSPELIKRQISEREAELGNVKKEKDTAEKRLALLGKEMEKTTNDDTSLQKIVLQIRKAVKNWPDDGQNDPDMGV